MGNDFKMFNVNIIESHGKNIMKIFENSYFYVTIITITLPIISSNILLFKGNMF